MKAMDAVAKSIAKPLKFADNHMVEVATGALGSARILLAGSGARRSTYTRRIPKADGHRKVSQLHLDPDRSPETHRESHAIVWLEALEAGLTFTACHGGQQDCKREEQQRGQRKPHFGGLLR